MSIRPQSKGCKSKTRREFGHLRVIDPDDEPGPLLKHHCIQCLDTGLDLSLTTERAIKAHPCSKCASSENRSVWQQKVIQADHINRTRISLSMKLHDALRHMDFLIGDEGLPSALKGRVEDLFSNVSKAGPRTPVSDGELAAVLEIAQQGKLWAGKLDEGETSCPHLVSRIPALFRPETRGRKAEARTDGITRGWHGETILVRPEILTTAHQRIILALTHLHHQKGFRTNETETSLKEVLGLIQKKTGGSGLLWLKERLAEIQSCRLTIINDLGGLYGTTRNTITTGNEGSPIFTWEERPRGMVITWNEYFLVQYRRHLYSRINLDLILSLPPVAQLIYVFLASHDNDASWLKQERWMAQIGMEETKKTRETFRLAIKSLEREGVINADTLIDKCVWILLTRGVNFDLPSFAPEQVKEKAIALAAAAKKPRLATENEITPWGTHGAIRSSEKAKNRAGASVKEESLRSGKLAEGSAERMKKKAEF